LGAYYRNCFVAEAINFDCLVIFDDHEGERTKVQAVRKGDILSCLEPQEARWGFTDVQDDDQRWRVMKTLEKMSLAAPRLNWVIYEECNGGELMLRDGELVT
jgi:hypothetical protein